jgi:thiosulfate/3-mercaptopyruvate sulfurtransferase
MAARVWWLLRWLGHDRVAVLDGGWPAWVSAGNPVTQAIEHRAARRFIAHPRPELALSAEPVNRVRTDPSWRVFDARAADRFRGENETIDPTPGHIPGAHSLPYTQNIGPDGRLQSIAELRARLTRAMDGVPAERAVCYCGSGITAAHNVLAIAHAGLGDARLYPGSWSEWITDPDRPVAKGPE